MSEMAHDPRDPTWDFPGWGTAERIDDLATGPVTITQLDSGTVHKLGIWRSTAICGNDITSSCLYVTAIAAYYAGPYAPLALALVAGVLFLFRRIYAEVGMALPLNGGAYNVLLNTTTKGQAWSDGGCPGRQCPAEPQYVLVFLLYFGTAGTAVGLMLLRVRLLRVALSVSDASLARFDEANTRLSRWIRGEIQRIKQRQIIFFTEDDSLPLLNETALYVLQNEQNKWLRVVHCYTITSAIPAELGTNIGIIDHIYPELRIDLILVQGEFGPALIERLSQRLDIPKNYRFIGTPSDRFPHSLASLGGVRLIM